MRSLRFRRALNASVMLSWFQEAPNTIMLNSSSSCSCSCRTVSATTHSPTVSIEEEDVRRDERVGTASSTSRPPNAQQQHPVLGELSALYWENGYDLSRVGKELRRKAEREERKGETVPERTRRRNMVLQQGVITMNDDEGPSQGWDIDCILKDETAAGVSSINRKGDNNTTHAGGDDEHPRHYSINMLLEYPTAEMIQLTHSGIGAGKHNHQTPRQHHHHHHKQQQHILSTTSSSSFPAAYTEDAMNSTTHTNRLSSVFGELPPSSSSSSGGGAGVGQLLPFSSDNSSPAAMTHHSNSTASEVTSGRKQHQAIVVEIVPSGICGATALQEKMMAVVFANGCIVSFGTPHVLVSRLRQSLKRFELAKDPLLTYRDPVSRSRRRRQLLWGRLPSWGGGGGGGIASSSSYSESMKQVNPTEDASKPDTSCCSSVSTGRNRHSGVAVTCGTTQNDFFASMYDVVLREHFTTVAELERVGITAADPNISYIDDNDIGAIVLSKMEPIHLLPFAFCFAELVELKAMNRMLAPIADKIVRWQRHVMETGSIAALDVRDARRTKAQVLRMRSRHSKMTMTRYSILWDDAGAGGGESKSIATQSSSSASSLHPHQRSNHQSPSSSSSSAFSTSNDDGNATPTTTGSDSSAKSSLSSLSHVPARAIYAAACDHYEVSSIDEELRSRMQTVAESAAYLSEEAHKDTDLRLEWVIIILIAMEIVIHILPHHEG